MSHQTSVVPFCLGLCAGGCITGTVLYLWLANSKSPVQAECDHGNKAQDAVNINDAIVKEHLSRNIQFFGTEGSKLICQSRVVVVGCGGVGSHAAHMLLRAGVGWLRIVDFDQVTLSSLNRHAVATRADVGLPKASVLCKHFKRIFPEVYVETMVEMYTQQTEELVLGGTPPPDYVLDAIDNLDTKADLLAACKKRSIPVLCVGGAGAKSDPTKLRFMDLAEASTDPLVRAVRHRLRTTHGIKCGIDVLLSTEKPCCGLVTTDEQAAAPSMLDYQVIPSFRVRTIPVLGTSPAIFGMAAAARMLCSLAGQPFFPEPHVIIRRAQYETILEKLQDDEVAAHGHCDDIAVDLEEVQFLVSCVWRGCSAFKMGRGDGSSDKGLHRRTGHLTLVRFRKGDPCTPGNLVLLSDEEAAEFNLLGQAKWSEKYRDVSVYVEHVLKRVNAYFHG